VEVGYAAVKGTRWRSRDRVDLGAAGVAGDRRWCLVDVEARRVLRTIAHPALMSLAPDPRPTPTGEQVTCDYWGRPVDLALVDDPFAATASDLVGRPVRLAEAPPGAVVYGAGVSVVATGSLAAVDPGAGPSAEPARFRPSVVVDAGEAFAEERWLGAQVRLGSAVVRLTTLTPRCAVVDHHPVTGERDRPLLRRMVEQRGDPGTGPTFGLDGDVVVPGVVVPGDVVGLA